MTSPAARARCPPPVTALDGRPPGQQGRGTRRNRLCRAASPEQAREAGEAGPGGGTGPGGEDGDFRRRGSDRAGHQPHYRDMDSGASHAASARARRPARSGSGIPPPPSTALGSSSIPPPPVTALASCSAIPPAPVTALASSSPIPPPP